ncbi:transcriptional regulator [Mesorhizobium tianshanense]|uniref:Helix-turn-helix protein n=2 Tax=Mesorhizobium tianshanense TaxID=39844 RepID=A0A562P3X5_9HYPH|nr:helix-turn-helix protein [Mesorhizobium tianshanense]GLS41594.1 transcriptional regulator [Mesorhizobium tianshanense]
MLTSAQCRAARALVDWSREKLSEQSKVSHRSIVDFERGAREPRLLTKEALVRALDAAGVEFIPENGGGAGVRLRKSRPTAPHLPDGEAGIIENNEM